MKAPFSEPYTARHNIWEFQSIVSRRLLWWAVGNVIVGMWLQQRRSKFLRGMGMQSISWGAINAMIAVGGTGVPIRVATAKLSATRSMSWFQSKVCGA
ncbi:MAG: hypothetical protein AAFV33_12460 [Chloroflexota bacterium]